ncbi:MAG: hypothetical protein F4039_08990 [Gammaproteobacteria bacterium]|nr:hypothetical protein [Gammaproteobacteria bacterium]MYK44205.1 hypothetical protein [Gammaproteobacteria bacterium]
MTREELTSWLEQHKPDIDHCRNVAVRPISKRNRELIKVGDDEYYIRNYEWIISNDKVDSHYTYMDPETTLPNFARNASEGVPIQPNHDYRVMQLGLSTKGTFDAETNEVLAEGYIQEDLTDVNSNDIISRLDTRTAKWVSVGFRGDEVCSFDGSPMHWFWGDCEHGHVIGDKIMIDKDGKETSDPDKMVRTETIYSKVVDGELLEFSPVWRGSTPGAELIGEVRSLFRDGKIDKPLERNLSRKFGMDVRSLLIGKDKPNRSISKPIKRRHRMSVENMVPQEDYDEVSQALDAALAENLELKKNPTREEFDSKIDEMTAQIADSEKELTEVRSKLKENEDTLEEIPLAITSLRKDALDAFADAAGLSHYERDSNEEYQSFKESIESTDSIVRLINKRRHYETRNKAVNGGRKMYSREEDNEKVETPAPVGFPTQDAYNSA